MPGFKCVALYAHCWEAFVRLRFGQAQNGRFALHELETSTEFGDPRNELPHVRVQDGKLFITNSVWLSVARSPLSCLLRAEAALTPAPAIVDGVSFSEDHSLRTEV